MPWMKVDDGLQGHPKAIRAGVAAMGLWLMGASWCAQQLTDGWLPLYIAARIDPEYLALGARLVAVRLFEPMDVRDDEQGWQYHDWLDYNPSRAQVLAKRKADAARQQRARSRAAEARHGVTHDGLTPSITVSPTRPDPTQPPPPSPPQVDEFTPEWEAWMVKQLRDIRGDWLEEDIRKTLAHRKVRERPPDVVARAAVLIARDPATQRISRLAANHQYWSAARLAPTATTAARAAIPPHLPADDGLGGCTKCPLPARHMIHSSNE